MPPLTDPLQPSAAEQIYARTYDSVPIGWPGEIDAYLRWAHTASGGRPPRVLEVACGTGRVAIPMAAGGCNVLGLDAWAEMIEVARGNSPDGNPDWAVGDMRSFRVGRRFDIAIVPAHSFQFMLTADDQVAALVAIRHHLRAGGRLVVHVDRPEHAWLADLPSVAPDLESWEIGQARQDKSLGAEWHMRYAWTLDEGTEVASLHVGWVRLDGGSVTEAVGQEPMCLKVVGRVEMEHALRRAGFSIEAVFGDFEERPYTGGEGGMIWLAISSPA